MIDAANGNGNGPALGDAFAKLPAGIRERFAKIAERTAAEEAARPAMESTTAFAAPLAARPADSWPPLRLFDLGQVPLFPIDVFPPALKIYCQEVAAAQLVPVELVGPTMLGVLSAAIGQSVNLKVKKNWHESALLYMILVAPAGAGKSPTLRTVTRPLVEYDRQLRIASRKATKEWKLCVKEYREAKRAHQLNPDQNPPPGQDPGDEEPKQKRSIVKDVTREGLAPLLRDNPHGLLCDPDEATAWIGSFNEYKAKGADREFWLSIWSSTTVIVDRKGGKEDIYVPFPFVTVLASMVPDRLPSLAEEKRQTDGFTDRILFSYPDPATWPSQQWIEREISEWAEQQWHSIVLRLRCQKMRSEFGSERPWVLQFDEDARLAWKTWWNEHTSESESEDLPHRMTGAYSKMRIMAARLTLIMARVRQACAVEHGDPPQDSVTAEDVRRAAVLVGYFKGQAARVSSALCGTEPSCEAFEILRLIQANAWPSFRVYQINGAKRRFRRDPNGLSACLTELEKLGAIRPVGPKQAPQRGRHPSPSYEVHPDLHSQKASKAPSTSEIIDIQEVAEKEGAMIAPLAPSNGLIISPIIGRNDGAHGALMAPPNGASPSDADICKVDGANGAFSESISRNGPKAISEVVALGGPAEGQEGGAS